ncbi:site-specific recombinase XerD-like protein [Chondrocystis sp. NIES-4102]|nr:site-specific recombinase XerD-like protein [Chondrocystis sp. NIES-4102]
MVRLVSEQLPNDGGYHVKRLVDEANSRLEQIGRRGKRAKIVAKRNSLTVQFNFNDGNGSPQKNVGLGGIVLNPKGIDEAERIASLVTGQLAANQFTWDWYNALIGKDTSEKAKALTCKEMLEEYKAHYFKQRKGNKTPQKSWYEGYRQIEAIISELDKPISLSVIRQIVDLTENNSLVRTKTLNGLVAFFKYFDNSDYKTIVKEYKANNKPEARNKSVPSDKRIAEVYRTGFEVPRLGRKDYLHRYSQWQFLYGLLATYGLRIHEAWNIANWDKPVTLKSGDWVIVDDGNDNETATQHTSGDVVIPAILDPDNKDHILCIKHTTKTGYRMAMPLSPEGSNWIQEFNLLQPLNLPDIKDPLKIQNQGRGSYNCTSQSCRWFRDHKYGFTAHALRHAYNHRGHLLGYNPKVLADSLGHSLQMNSDNYLRHMSAEVKLQGMLDSINKDKESRSELDRVNAENKALKDEVTHLKNELELLKTKLKMYEAIEDSRKQK